MSHGLIVNNGNDRYSIVVHGDGDGCAESEGKELVVSRLDCQQRKKKASCCCCIATGDVAQNRKEVLRFDLVSTMEEEGIQLLLQGDGDGMQNRKKVVSWIG